MIIIGVVLFQVQLALNSTGVRGADPHVVKKSAYHFFF